ncbi:hypothetical protein [Moorella sp. Hama-1]|uniref:hypothetical protein n=1 Tax=Moorella sp. Hama-1 TaxID=2138101 RepID=UPI000D6513C4|nr:hypothetical protein [Moorella sp. Hama-1]BCV22277.1 hypothetical protein hamaS1_23460 [Moorella sp. Hama-1]
MATFREEIIHMIREMPEDASVEDIMAELYFRKKVDRGLQQLKAGQVLTHDQARDRLKKWLE